MDIFPRDQKHARFEWIATKIWRIFDNKITSKIQFGSDYEVSSSWVLSKGNKQIAKKSLWIFDVEITSKFHNGSDHGVSSNWRFYT